MTGSSLAGIIGAAAGVITAVSLLVGAFATLLPQLKLIRKTGEETHKIVNQQRTDMANYQRALIRALAEHDIDIPIDQSITDGKGN